MKSFRTEIENPIVEKDILDLEQKIHAFQHQKIDEEKFTMKYTTVQGIQGFEKVVNPL